ncbi:cytochrome P450 81Q32-like [Silene latifolia]|uniref:cytochrome P450 81Q32-like n=1 Tax=Silene latifolia TaxID=37657 RepID=UPI003D789E34
MEFTILVALFYLTTFIISYLITQLILHKFQNLPPSPFPAIPILGHLHLLKNHNTIHRTLSNLSNKFGLVLHLQLGSRPTVVISSAQAAEDCLHVNDIVFANRPVLVGSEITGYGGTTMAWAPYGPLWRAHRKIASTEILSVHRVNALCDIRADEVKLLLRRIQVEGANKIIEIKSHLVGLATNVIMRMVAGKRIYNENDNEDAKRFGKILDALHGEAFDVVDFFPFLKYLGLKKMAEKRFGKIFVGMDAFLQELVDEQKKKVEELDGECDGVDKKNLIRVLLDLKKNDPSYATDDIIKGLVQNLLLAGTETTASTMEWALTLLLKNPEVLKSAKQEIDNHVGKNRLLEESDLSHLPYLHCIINETLRMYPAAPLFVPHESSSDCMVNGYRIPKGTLLNVNVWAIQNDPKIWNDPTKFKPERFKGVKGDKIRYEFMPFGSGRRACPGENLAMRVVGLTLGSIIQCFDLKRVGEIDMEEKVSLTMWKAKPLRAKFLCYSDMVELLSHI